MPPLSRAIALLALPLTLTACQTYEATYVETPQVRRTVMVERSYDPFYEPASTTIYRERRVYRDPFYDPYAPAYRERRFERDVYPRRTRPYVGPPVEGPGYVYRGDPAYPRQARPDRPYNPQVLPPGTVVPAPRDEGSSSGYGIGR